MTIIAPVRPAPVLQRKSLRGRLADRRLQARQDRLTARLVELHAIAELSGKARAVIENGWVQRGWYRYENPHRDENPHRVENLHRYENPRRGTNTIDDLEPIAGACLVGAIVYAGGGPKAFTSQLVQRTLDLTWNTLYGVDGDSLAWCPPPAVRISHVHDLTRWNDQPSRTRGEVLDLLAATQAEAGRLSELIRDQRLATVPS